MRDTKVIYMRHSFFIRQWMVAVSVMFASFAISSCSDDDNENDNVSLAGTSWTVLSVYDEEDEQEIDDSAFLGMRLDFQKDGNCKLTPNDGWDFCKWDQNGNTLKIVLGEDGEPDDYLSGIIIFNGEKAKYTYQWHDYYGDWDGETPNTMTLIKVN